MKVELTNGCTYTIPKDVLKMCKHLQIAYTHIELELFSGTRPNRRQAAFKRNEEFLKYYRYIGYQELPVERLNIDVELHWFIREIDLHKCRCDVS